MVQNPSYGPDAPGEPRLKFEGKDPEVREEEWVAAPVKKGQ